MHIAVDTSHTLRVPAEEIRRHGFARLLQRIPDELLQRLDRSAEQAMTAPENQPEPHYPNKWKSAYTYAAQLAERTESGPSPELAALYELASICASAAVNAGLLSRPDIVNVQIAEAPPQNGKSVPFHVDGWGELVRESYRWKELPGYILIFGIALTTTSSENSGNLVVFPGGHRKVANFFKEKIAPYKGAYDDTCDTEPFGRMVREVEFGEGEQLRLNRGDVVVMHHLLPHEVIKNESATARRHVYVRVGVPAVKGVSAFTDVGVNLKSAS